jgi:hypothetical protein
MLSKITGGDAEVEFVAVDEVVVGETSESNGLSGVGISAMRDISEYDIKESKEGHTFENGA